MLSEDLTYNLPGYGLIQPTLFPYAAAVWGFFRDTGHIDRLKRTNQLGVLRNLYPGAHHTRYEYVIAQLALISELCKRRRGQNPLAPLGSKRTDFGTLGAIGTSPSGGEVLQCLTILANVGHLPQTFASQRALLHHLRTCVPARRAFRAGLPRQDRDAFDTVLARFHMYQVHYFIAVFLLERYRRRTDGHQMADFCQKIIRSFRARQLNDHALISLWELHRSVRRVTYLALDSLYTSVPFSLDFAAILLSLEQQADEVFNPFSQFQQALNGFERVMRHSVYLSPNAVIQFSRSTDRAVRECRSAPLGWSSLSALRGMLAPTTVSDDLFDPKRDALPLDWDKTRVLGLWYDFDSRAAPRTVTDTVELEEMLRRRVGPSRCRIGIEWDPATTRLSIGAALAPDLKPNRAMSTAFRIAYELARFESQSRELAGFGWLNDFQDDYENARRLVEFLLRALFGWNNRYRLRAARVRRKYPVVVGTGAARTASILRSFVRDPLTAKVLENPDDLHEIKVVQRTLELIAYQGVLIAFAGRVEVIDPVEGRQLGEFDGVVFLLSENNQIGCALIVEAKNMAHGHTAARHQLKTRLTTLDFPSTRYTLHDVETIGAYATISPL